MHVMLNPAFSSIVEVGLKLTNYFLPQSVKFGIHAEHELGHAVMCGLYGVPVVYVKKDIMKHYFPLDNFKHLMIVVAGEVAESGRLYPRAVAKGDSPFSDEENAWHFASKLCGSDDPDKIEAVTEWACDAARYLLGKVKKQTETVRIGFFWSQEHKESKWDNAITWLEQKFETNENASVQGSQFGDFAPLDLKVEAAEIRAVFLNNVGFIANRGGAQSFHLSSLFSRQTPNPELCSFEALYLRHKETVPSAELRGGIQQHSSQLGDTGLEQTQDKEDIRSTIQDRIYEPTDVTIHGRNVYKNGLVLYYLNKEQQYIPFNPGNFAEIKFREAGIPFNQTRDAVKAQKEAFLKNGRV